MEKHKTGERYNPHRIFTGIFIPEAIVKIPNMKLSYGAKICFGRLFRYAGKDGIAFPKRSTLAKEIGSSERSVDRFISELKKFELIDVERKGLHKSNRYYFIWHEVFDGEDEKTASPKSTNVATQNSQDSTTPIERESEERESEERESEERESEERESEEIYVTESKIKNFTTPHDQNSEKETEEKTFYYINKRVKDGKFIDIRHILKARASNKELEDMIDSVIEDRFSKINISHKTLMTNNQQRNAVKNMLQNPKIGYDGIRWRVREIEELEKSLEDGFEFDTKLPYNINTPVKLRNNYGEVKFFHKKVNRMGDYIEWWNDKYANN